MLSILLLLLLPRLYADRSDLHSSPNVVYELHKTFEHDSECFTQGLLFYNEYLYESCGLFGHSHLKKMDPETGNVLIRYDEFPRSVFSEGIVIVGEDLYMLTWQSKDLYVFSADTLTLKFQTKFTTYRGQGWGIVYDGTHFIASDGSNRLTYMTVPHSKGEVSTFVKDVKVKEKRGMHLTSHSNGLVDNINELELVDGKIYANIWYKDVIVIIDPRTGDIETKVDMSLLYPKRTRSHTADCLNGIAYHRGKQQFLLTGKLWPSYYWVHFEDRQKGKKKRRKLKRKTEELENSTSRDLLDSTMLPVLSFPDVHLFNGERVPISGVDHTHETGDDNGIQGENLRSHGGRFQSLTNHSHQTHSSTGTNRANNDNDDIGSSAVEGNLEWVPGVLIATTIGVFLMCVLLKLLVWIHDVNYDYEAVPSLEASEGDDGMPVSVRSIHDGNDVYDLKRIEVGEGAANGSVSDTSESKELPYGTHRRTSAGNAAEL